MKRMYTREGMRDRMAAQLRRRGRIVVEYNVSDGSGTMYGLEYTPKTRQTKERGHGEASG